MDRRLVVTIKPDGTVKIEAEGFEGQGCEAATLALAEALGVVTGAERKSEFWLEEKREVLR